MLLELLLTSKQIGVLKQTASIEWNTPHFVSDTVL